LAVDKRYKRTGLGSKTLVYALREAVALSKAGLPAYGFILDVLDEEALGFYQHFELFEPFTDDPMRLFVSMKTLEQI
jgi:GNAT superfamily N-acetyltransferase